MICGAAPPCDEKHSLPVLVAAEYMTLRYRSVVPGLPQAYACGKHFFPMLAAAEYVTLRNRSVVPGLPQAYACGITFILTFITGFKNQCDN